MLRVLLVRYYAAIVGECPPGMPVRLSVVSVAGRLCGGLIRLSTSLPSLQRAVLLTEFAASHGQGGVFKSISASGLRPLL